MPPAKLNQPKELASLLPCAKKAGLLLPSPLYPGRLNHCYQRFLADMELAGGTIVAANCPKVYVA